ncbi:MAG: biotin carboxylase [Alteromonadaceae bacterium]|jgi:biotin carboxylase
MNNQLQDESQEIKKWLIAVTAGRWQVSTIKLAKSMGIGIIAIDTDPEAEGFLFADKVIVASLDNFNEITTQIGQQPISGVLSICSDAGMLLAGRLRDYYCVSTGPNLQISQRLVNKALQRQCWENANVNGPIWQVSNDIEYLQEIAFEKPLPFIIKPVDSAGSRGVFKVTRYDESIKEYLYSAQSFSSNGEVIIESFMEGEEFTVEAFVNKKQTQILCITAKKKIKSTSGLVAYQLTSAELNDSTTKNMEQLVVDAVTALNYQNGPCHAEVILMKDGSIGMVELAGRGGGFLVFESFVELASGFDIALNTIKQAIGLSLDPSHLIANHTILHFFPNKSGVVVEICGFNQSNTISGVKAASFVCVGDKLNNACCDGDRMGYFISSAESIEKSERQAQQVKKLINFRVKS